MALESPLSEIETARISYFSCTGKKILEVQILEPQSPALYIVIVLSCPLIGSRSSSTANQRAGQKNCRSLGSQDLYFLNFFTCTSCVCHTTGQKSLQFFVHILGETTTS